MLGINKYLFYYVVTCMENRDELLTYPQILEKLYGVSRFPKKHVGLWRMEALLEKLKGPHTHYPSIHVAGTNGKGSTVTKIAVSFQKAGYRVGLYTSPHISTFRERISINGELISEQDIVRLFNPIFSHGNTLLEPPTFFELVTALMFAYFSEQKVDLAVIEAGLGGRLDATNVVKSSLSVITSVSLDHTAILGDSIEKITFEKAHIAKPKTPLVIGPNVQKELVMPIAGKIGASVFQVKGSFQNFEEENRAVARQACEMLSLPQEAIVKGSLALPPCRFERVPDHLLLRRQQKKPFGVILDVGHNPDGIEKLFLRVEREFGSRSVHVVFGACQDKDFIKCLETILKKAKKVTFVQARLGRAAGCDLLLQAARPFQCAGQELEVSTSVEQGIEKAFAAASQEEALLIITGTFFIMGAARAFLGFHDDQDPLDLNETILQK